MRAIRISYDNGNTVETNINGTVDEINEYYVGKQFNLGDGAGGDLLATATRVEFLDAIHSRQDYLAGKCSHDEFYAQYVTPLVRKVVLSGIGRDKIATSRDEHFNDIPLARWDRLAESVRSSVARMNVKTGAYPKPAASLSDCVCTLKAAARIIAAE